ncbi:T9SS type A sorting domain-containing protein [Aquimarina sp. 2201CG14-23]|uniref:T9SS type A sorting domain-containing protein n=1 Tax=Aquimarina mycalae TaxID=3040073 RepID=UPI002477E358|nr:T9SS type A sorting domain-containing protein [Aquimarina sp. 2201CG14-23]MDH7445882.1 T9SS type A sorting domain-containing protein [Aquimarina sp. 2201CG14-23]
MKSYFLKLTSIMTLFIGILGDVTFGQCTVGQPNISVQAEAFSNITIVEGTSTTLTSPISGTTYQWTLNGVHISGATSSSLTVHNFSSSDIGDYNVIVDSTSLLNSVSLGIFSSSISDYDRDRQALIDFYNSTNGPSWIDSTNWLAGPIETWKGVKVENCRVTELRLSGNNISGTIPASFRNLTELKRLSIRDNDISGILDITAMPSLLDLHTSNNDLTDIRFGNNDVLQRVHIQNNPFTPGKTIDISRMTQLIDFRAASLNLADIITTGTYNNLLYFIIRDNQISGTLDISRMPNLRLCYAHNNQFTNFSLGTGAELSRFYFYNNPITPGRTMDISGMRKLLDFRIQGLELSQLIMSGTYDEMLYFIIRDNQIGGTLDISMMPNLRLCYAFNNQFTDFKLGSHPELGRFYFYNNPVTPGRTMDISSMRKLLDFRVQGLGLSQLIMSGTYDEMLYFIIKDNQIGGTLDISMMPKIVLCNAENNFFEDLMLPSNVTGSGRTLSHLHVRNNNLHFDDLLPYSSILGTFSFSYNRQRNVATTVSGNTISVNVGGGMDYTWNPSGPNTSSFAVSTSDTYSCEVRNAAVPGLVIYSDPVFVSVSARASINDNTFNKGFGNINGITTYPNPIQRGKPIFSDIILKDSELIKIVLYTINGKKVREFDHPGKVGRNTVQLSSEGLSAGQYILTSGYGFEKVSQTIIIQ